MDVNGIDLIVVPTPKVAKVRAHFLVPPPPPPHFLSWVVQKLMLMSIFTCCEVAVVCRYYSKITDALVVGWCLLFRSHGAAAGVVAMVGVD